MASDEMNAFNKKIIDEFRANGGKVGPPFAGAPMILLTTKGAKSGRLLTTPLVYNQEGEQMTIIASMAGAPNNPAWYHNIVANPRIEVEVGTEKFWVNARETNGEERDTLYAKQAAKFPAFADYETKTTRKIPVFVLTRQTRGADVG